MKIWLDDVRPAPDGWFLCRSVNEAKKLIERMERSAEEAQRRAERDRAPGQGLSPIWKIVHRRSIELISLDHDLGDMAKDGGDGIKLMDWLLERGSLYRLQFHTANPVGRENMERMYRRYWLKETI